MAFYGYKGEFNECFWNPSGTTYADGFVSSPIQSSIFQFSSSYEFGESVVIENSSSSSSAYFTDDSNLVAPSGLNYNYTEPTIMQLEPPIEYNSSYYPHYENSAYPSEINYSAYHYSPPRLLQYNPFPETIYTISYSTVGSDKTKSQEEGFNEPEFEEYDPTPYGGGYDMITTYGKPLPPSDKTCYPPSVPQSDGKSMDNFSYNSIPSPYGKDEVSPIKPPNAGKEIDTKIDSESSDSEDGESVESLALIVPADVSPSYQQENRLGDEGFGYGRSERQGISYGAGLEAMDMCETIFGHWPCLAKIEEKERAIRREICDRERRNDPWNIAADYLFGSPVAYGYENYYNQD